MTVILTGPNTPLQEIIKKGKDDDQSIIELLSIEEGVILVLLKRKLNYLEVYTLH